MESYEGTSGTRASSLSLINPKPNSKSGLFPESCDSLQRHLSIAQRARLSIVEPHLAMHMALLRRYRQELMQATLLCPGLSKRAKWESCFYQSLSGMLYRFRFMETKPHTKAPFNSPTTTSASLSWGSKCPICTARKKDAMWHESVVPDGFVRHAPVVRRAHMRGSLGQSLSWTGPGSHTKYV